MLLKVKGEMYDGKKHSLDRNLTYFLVELTFIFPPISNISVFLKTTKLYIYKNVDVYFYLFPKMELAKSHPHWIFEQFGE